MRNTKRNSIVVSNRFQIEEIEMIQKAADIENVSRHRFMNDSILNRAKRIIRKTEEKNSL